MARSTLNLLCDYYTHISPNPAVLTLCGAERDVAYTAERDDDLTVIINGFARPAFLPLIWEAIQYQSRRPRETWLVQNDPGERATVPREFLTEVRGDGTRIIDSGLNHGCWFRFLVAALYCKTRYVAIFDDDTLPGRDALAAALADLTRQPGIYGGRGITYFNDGGPPRFWHHGVSGWPVGTVDATQVDFVGHMWVMETAWLRDMFALLPTRLFDATEPGRECGEDMFVSYVAQRRGLPTFVYGHGSHVNARWSSIQAYEMGFHPNAMNLTGGLSGGDEYLSHLVGAGWRLLQFT